MLFIERLLDWQHVLVKYIYLRVRCYSNSVAIIFSVVIIGGFVSLFPRDLDIKCLNGLVI